MTAARIVTGLTRQRVNEEVRAAKSPVAMNGISVEEWKNSRGRELLYRGQGKQAVHEEAASGAIADRCWGEGIDHQGGTGQVEDDNGQQGAAHQRDGAGCITGYWGGTPNGQLMGASTRPLDPGVMDAPGLQPPRMHTGDRVTGTNNGRHRRENKRRRREREAAQIRQSYWSAHTGDKPHLGPALTPPDAWRNDMCPRGLALHHPAAKTLLSYATQGCPVHTGQPWKLEWIEEAIRRGPHVSALVPEAIKQHRLGFD